MSSGKFKELKAYLQAFLKPFHSRVLAPVGVGNMGVDVDIDLIHW